MFGCPPRFGVDTGPRSVKERIHPPRLTLPGAVHRMGGQSEALKGSLSSQKRNLKSHSAEG